MWKWLKLKVLIIHKTSFNNKLEVPEKNKRQKKTEIEDSFWNKKLTLVHSSILHLFNVRQGVIKRLKWQVKLKKFYFNFYNLDKVNATKICNNYFQSMHLYMQTWSVDMGISFSHHLWMWSYMMFSYHWYAAYSVLTISSCGISILELSKYWKERKKASKFFPNDLQYTSRLDASNWKSCIKKENEKENKGEGVVHVPSSPSWVRPLGPFTLGVRDSKCWVP